MSRYGIEGTRAFRTDFERTIRGEPVFGNRGGRRIQKLGEHPRHHGYHAGAGIRCNWVAGVGDWAIGYTIDEARSTVVLLRFLRLDDI